MIICVYFYIFLSFAILGPDLLNDEYSQDAEMEKCQNINAISHVGFYNFTVNNDCRITVLFNSGSVHMFLFFDPFNAKDIELIIDEKKVNTGTKYANGRVIEGNSKATVKFYITDQIEKKVNIWLLPKSFCSNLSLYAYNSYLIDLKIPYTSPQICIFSPIFDSINNKFKFKFGINSPELDHISSIYTKSYYCPHETETGSNIKSTKIKGSAIIDFRFNELPQSNILKNEKDQKYYNNFIFYKRITNQINSDKSNQKNSIGSIAKCNAINGCVSEFFPPLEVIVEGPNWASNIEIIPLVLILSASIILIVFCICCCRLIKKKWKIRSIEDDISGLIIDNDSNNLNNSNLIENYFAPETPTVLND